MCDKIKKFPTKVQFGLGKLFAEWASIVSRCTTLIFVLALFGFGYAGSGLRYAVNYDNNIEQPFSPIVSSFVLS